MHSCNSDSDSFFLRVSGILSIGALGTAALGMTTLLLFGSLASLVTFGVLFVAAASMLAQRHLARYASRRHAIGDLARLEALCLAACVTSGLGVGGYLWAITGNVWPSVVTTIVLGVSVRLFIARRAG